MSTSSESLITRLGKLGLHCDEVPTDRLSSATAALACFPMYMVANCSAWSEQSQGKRSFADWPGFGKIREAFAIGEEEAQLEIDKEHTAVLRELLSADKPGDRIVFNDALETLGQFLEIAEPSVVDRVRTAVARMVVSVAKAAGEGLFGSGEKINSRERECMKQIAQALGLRETEAAAQILRETGSSTAE